MLSPESLQIQSYLFVNKTAQSASGSLAERRASFDGIVEKYAGHPIPSPVLLYPVSKDSISILGKKSIVYKSRN